MNEKIKTAETKSDVPKSSEKTEKQHDKTKELEAIIKEQETQISKLSSELEETKTKMASYLNTASYYKNEAETNKKDFERFKERNKDIEIQAKKSASEKVSKQLLPILDNFDQAISQVDAEIMRGFTMIYSSMQNVLTDLGLVEISCKNEKLNPEFHNCINTEPTNDETLDGQIANIYQKGYKFAETNEVVRVATVSVYKLNK